MQSRTLSRNIVFYQAIKEKSPKADLIVIRLTKSGQLVDSKPCRQCTRLIQKSRAIRFVYYSTQQGTIECIRSDKLSSTKIAKGTIYRSKGRKHHTPGDQAYPTRPLH